MVFIKSSNILQNVYNIHDIEDQLLQVAKKAIEGFCVIGDELNTIFSKLP